MAGLHEMLNQPKLRALLPPLPIIDDFRNALETVLTWKTATGAQIATHLAQTFDTATALIRQRVAALMDTLATDLNDVAATLHTETLAQIAGTLTARLGEIRLAVGQGCWFLPAWPSGRSTLKVCPTESSFPLHGNGAAISAQCCGNSHKDDSRLLYHAPRHDQQN